MLVRKVILAAIGTTLLCSSVMAEENHNGQTVSLGYQHGHIKDFGDVEGGNIKFQYETSGPWGVMGSLTAMKNDWENGKSFFNRKSRKDTSDDKSEKKNAVRNAQYFSAMVGPTYRVADRVSLFALGGISHSKVDKPLVQDPGLSGHLPVLSKNGAESSNKFAYGAGVTVNATDNLALTVGYEGSTASFEKKNHQMHSMFVDVGFHF